MSYYNECQMLWSCSNNIRYYEYMIETSNDPCLKMCYENLLNLEKNKYCQLYNQLSFKTNNSVNNEVYKSDFREFTLEELKENDGSNGKPAYVAINGIVYDVSLKAVWGGGTHFSLYAGQDLTNQFNSCHFGSLEVLRTLPQIGILTT